MRQGIFMVILWAAFILNVSCKHRDPVGSGEDVKNQKNVDDDTFSKEGSGNDDEDVEYSGSGESSGDETYEREEGGSASGKVVIIKSTAVPSSTSRETTSIVVDINVGTSTTVTKIDTTKNNVITDKSTSTMGNEVEINVIAVGVPKAPKNAVTAKQESNQVEDSGIGFTLGITIGVVVGSILAILIIIFLVYRLRKKDEGSYSLDDQSSQFIRDSDSPNKGGKEYFA